MLTLSLPPHQVWVRDEACAPKDALAAEYHADPALAVMADACFEGFRSARCAAAGCAGQRSRARAGRRECRSSCSSRPRLRAAAL